MAVPHIDGRTLSKEDLKFLANEYVREIQTVESGRQELVDNYELWVENYEGDTEPPESEKPWEGASDGHIPKTATDTDVTFARFMNAIFGQFPKFMIRPLSGHWTEFARQTQRFSEWLEDSEIPLYKTMQQALLIAIKFGSSVVYIPWENKPVKHMRLDDNDTFVEEELDESNKPVLRVIHSKDFLLPLHSTDIQTAPWVAYKYKLRRATLKLWKKRDFFRKDAAQFLLDMFNIPTDQKQEHLAIPEVTQNFDRTQEARDRVAGIVQTKAQDALDMVHVWARLDIDGDGLEEDVNYHLHPASGTISRIAYNHYRHRKRPFVDFHFFPRDGIWYSIGIPEMLRNVQKNINVTFRQIQDNNTVKNTQTFKAKEGGSITPNEPFHPARIFFVREMDQLEPMRMGDGAINTSIQDLETMMDQGNRRTGVSDPSQGIGGNDRTPATTTLALLQESSRRIDLIIGQTRESLGELWMQVLELYAQFKPVVEFEILEDEKFSLLAWDSMSDEDFRKRIMVKPTASTTALNKAVARTEMSGLNEQMIAHNQSVVGLIDSFLQAQDPVLKEYLKTPSRASTKSCSASWTRLSLPRTRKRFCRTQKGYSMSTPYSPPSAEAVPLRDPQVDRPQAWEELRRRTKARLLELYQRLLQDDQPKAASLDRPAQVLETLAQLKEVHRLLEEMDIVERKGQTDGRPTRRPYNSRH